MILWIGIMVVVLGGGCLYLCLRLINTTALSHQAKVWAWIVLSLLMLMPIASMVFHRFLERFGDAWSWATYVTLGFLSLLLTVLVVRDCALLVGKGVSVLLSFFQRSTAASVDSSRRQLLLQGSNLAVIGVAGMLTAYGIYQARRSPGIVELHVPIKDLPDEFEEFRIVQISDIHAGLTVKRPWISSIVRQVHELKPDLIAFTGDLADGSVAHLKEDVAPLAELQAPHGKFFITGNHEYYSGAEAWVEEAKHLGFRVLLNEHTLISRNGASIVLAGVTDYSGGDFLPQHRSDPGKAIEGAPQEMVRILLAHQPRSIYAADPLGYDLTLSGHTHGGQFFPWNLLATIGQPYIKGLHERGGRWVYVSKGTGYWGPPVRLAARSEITVCTLTRPA